MKRIIGFSLVVAIIGLAAGSFAATPSRKVGTVTTGSASYTNTDDYAVRQLLSAEVSGVQPTSFTGTLQHVQDGFTNTVATLTSSGTGAAVATNLSTYIFKGGILNLAVGTNSAARYRFIFNISP